MINLACGYAQNRQIELLTLSGTLFVNFPSFHKYPPIIVGFTLPRLYKYFRYNWVFHDRTTVFMLVSSMYVVFKIKTLQHFLKSFLADKLSI